MTPNGTLIAYSTPADIRIIRDQIALVSMTWKEQLAKKYQMQPHQGDHDHVHELSESLRIGLKRAVKADALETLTLEFERRNILVRYLQARLLLVLEGGVPSSRKRELKITVEAPGESRYPPDTGADMSSSAHLNGDLNGGGQGEHADEAREQYGSPSAMSQASTAISSTGRRMGVLDVHRRKLDALAKAIGEEFARDGFEMPGDGGDKFF